LYNIILSNAWERLPKAESAGLKRDTLLYERRTLPRARALRA